MKDKIKIIFLDVDGVMNSERYYLKHTAGELLRRRDTHGDDFDDLSRDLLNELIDRTGAKVVVSASMRSHGLKSMRHMWKKRGMRGEIEGITPYIHTPSGTVEYTNSLPRGLEIQWYYENVHGFKHRPYDRSRYAPFELEMEERCTLSNYVCLDDDQDFLYEQRDNFVWCDPKNGFTRKHFNRALKILNG